MSLNTTPRAIKKAYFSDLEGGNILEFQFAPSELDFSEGGQFADRVMTGNYFTDLVWISGRPNNFQLPFFIDRTQESYVVENYNQDPFDSIKRFPSAFKRMANLDIVNLIEGIKNSNTSSGFASSFKKRTHNGANEVKPSGYSASPHYKQDSFDENVGVYKDLEALMYYVRPLGLKLADMTISQDGVVKITDFKQGRFTPPPMVRFYFGSIWREGYVTEVKYNLSVMNKKLVPRRLDAIISMSCTRWGYLNELTTPNDAINSGGSIDDFTNLAQ